MTLQQKTLNLIFVVAPSLGFLVDATKNTAKQHYVAAVWKKIWAVTTLVRTCPQALTYV